MKDNAVSQVDSRRRGVLAAVALWLVMVGVAVFAILAASAAAAAPIGKGGQVNACYLVKGKEKGSMRVVAGKHCRRGERKLAWSLAGPQAAAAEVRGPQGSAGAEGPPGPQGLDGAPGADGASGVRLTPWKPKSARSKAK